MALGLGVYRAGDPSLKYSQPRPSAVRRCGGGFFPLGGIGLAEIAEPAFLGGPIRKFQRDLRRPAGFALDHIFHDTHGMGDSMDHGFPEITRPGFRYFGFAHGTENMRNRNQGASDEWWEASGQSPVASGGGF